MIHTDSDGHKSIINADEFQRLMTVKAPAEGSSDQAKIDWARSRERLFQDMMLPLFDHLRTMAQLPKGQAPIRRLAIFQVCPTLTAQVLLDETSLLCSMAFGINSSSACSPATMITKCDSPCLPAGLVGKADRPGGQCGAVCQWAQV
jgi:hypothetical protein